MKHFLVYGLSNSWGGVEAIVMAMIERLAGDFDFDRRESENVQCGIYRRGN